MEERRAMNQAKTILVVDDDPQIINLLSTVLGEAGYHVVIAKDGLEAVNQVFKLTPDLVIMDIKMPVLDGVRALGTIKGMPSSESGKRPPVILISGYAEKEKVIEAKKLNADDFLAKPFSIKELFARIDKDISKDGGRET